MDTLNQVKIRLNQHRAELMAMETRRQTLTAVILELQDVVDSLESEQPTTAPPAPKRQPRGSVEAAVLKGLDGGFYCTVEDLVAATQQKPNSIRAALKTLVKEGKAFEAAPGKFTNAKPSKPRSTEATPTEPPNGSEPAARFSADEIARHMPVG